VTEKQQLHDLVDRLPESETVAAARYAGRQSDGAGPVANLIVNKWARREVRIGFWEYARAGVPLTLLTFGVGIPML
jgi:hypothetical protein